LQKDDPMSQNGTIRGGRVQWSGEAPSCDDLVVVAGEIAAQDAAPAGYTIDASGLLVLPGIVDLHGDAFERQIMPRPRVGFPVDLALLDTDRQLSANGITTAFHSITWSWEPGLRDARMARALLDGIDALRDRLAVDTRFHLRQETYNLDGEAEIVDWLARGRIGILSFNDHVRDVIEDGDKPHKLQKYLDRSGLDHAGWVALVRQVAQRAADVPASIERLARAGRASGTAMMSHDDISPVVRDRFQGLGVTIAEFPETRDTAERARALANPIVFGAPNVVRGGSHTGAPDAAEMALAGLCSVLASDYYYPAPLQAPFRLAARGMAFADAWALVSANPAAAVGLPDRGRIAPGLRADLVLVDPAPPWPRAVATLVAGRVVHLAEGWRLA
jgi:alpha-D-ribose 1-methylphosphonate 5-triphosphate diphosphatase